LGKFDYQDIDYQDESIFDKRKVEYNAIDYRLPINSSNPDCSVLPSLFSTQQFHISLRSGKDFIQLLHY